MIHFDEKRPFRRTGMPDAREVLLGEVSRIRVAEPMAARLRTVEELQWPNGWDRA